MKMEDITFHHVLPMQLRFSDADQFGHVNNAIFFEYYDTAKIDYIKSLNLNLGRKYAIFAVHIEADFLAQVFTDDHVEVQTAAVHIGTKSFKLQQRLVDTDTKEVKCVGSTIMVAYDLEKRESIEILPEWVDAMCKFEGRDLKKK